MDLSGKFSENCPIEFSGLQNSIFKILGRDCTLQEVFELKESKLITQKGFGVGKLKQFSLLKKYISDNIFLSNQDVEGTSTPEGVTPFFYKKNRLNRNSLFSEIEFDINEIKISTKIKENFGENLTVDSFLALNINDLINIPYLGEKKISLIQALQKKVELQILNDEKIRANFVEGVHLDSKVELKDNFISDLSTSNSKIQCIDVNFELEEKLIMDRVLNHFGQNLSVEDFLKIDYVQLKLIPGIGFRKIQKIENLKKKIAEKYGNNINDISKESDSTVDEYLQQEFSQVVVSPKYRSLIAALRDTGIIDNITIGGFLKIKDHEIVNIPGFGKKRLFNFKSLKEHILKNISEQNCSLSVNCEEDEELSFDSVSDILEKSLENFIVGLTSVNRYIFVHRYGIDSKEMTLEEIGGSLPDKKITRERVRQLQNKIEDEWCFSISYLKSSIITVVESNLSLLNGVFFDRLKSRFEKVETFFEFLCVTIGKEKSYLRNILMPSFERTILNDYWLVNHSPCDINNIIIYIQDNFSFDKAQAENILAALSSEGIIQIDESNNVKPLKLAKKIAIAHAGLSFPNGGTWEEIQLKAIQLNVSNGTIANERLEGSLMEAVNDLIIYQCGRGKYRNVLFLDLSENDISNILSVAKKILDLEKLNGNNTLNVMSGIYKKFEFDFDYYIVRHVLRAYGERLGIFFNGKSGADTVSLDSEFSIVSQKEAILNYIKNRKAPVTKDDVMTIIRSGTQGHAGFYISQLIEDRELVYIGNQLYDTPEKAFRDSNVEDIIYFCANIIDSDERYLDIDVLKRRVNRKFNLNHNKHFYSSMISFFKSIYGYDDWYVSYSVVCKKEGQFSSVTSIIKYVITEIYQNVDDVDLPTVIRETDNFLLSQPDTLMLAIKNVIAELRVENGNKQEKKSIIDSAITDDISDSSKIQIVPKYSEFGRKEIYELKNFLINLENELGDIEAKKWFTIFAIVRYMDANNLHSHGLRILPQKFSSQPEVLKYAISAAEILDLDISNVEQLMLDNRSEELYALLFKHSLHGLSFINSFYSNEIRKLPDIIFKEPFKTYSLIRNFSNCTDDNHWHHWSVFDSLYNLVIDKKSTKLFPSWMVTTNQYFKLFQECFCLNKEELIPEKLRFLDCTSGPGFLGTAFFNVLYDLYIDFGYKKRDVIPAIIENNNIKFHNENGISRIYFVIKIYFLALSKDNKFLKRDIDLASIAVSAYDYSLASFDFIVSSDEILINHIHKPANHDSYDNYITHINDSLKLLKPSGILVTKFDSALFVSNKFSNLRSHISSSNCQFHFNNYLDSTKVRGVFDFCSLVLKNKSRSSDIGSVFEIDYSLPNDDFTLKCNNFDISTSLSFDNVPFNYWLDANILYSLSKLPKLKSFVSYDSFYSYPSIDNFCWFEVMPMIDNRITGSELWALSAGNKTLTNWLHTDVEVCSNISQRRYLSVDNHLFATNCAGDFVFCNLSQGYTVDKNSGYILKSKFDLNVLAAVLNSTVFNLSKTLYSLPGKKSSLSISQIFSLPFSMPSINSVIDDINLVNSTLKKLSFYFEYSFSFNPLSFCSHLQLGFINDSFENWRACLGDLIHTINSCNKNINYECRKAYGLLGQDTDLSDFEIPFNPSQDLFFKELFSIFVGSVFGRYKYSFQFPRRLILPLCGDLFSDKIDSLFKLWLEFCFGQENFNDNINWIASLISSSYDCSGDFNLLIKHYASTFFYKDHCDKFLGSPIYFVISSGKKRAFQALIYVHAIDSSLFAKIRLEYVIPLISSFEASLNFFDIKIEESTTVVDKISLIDEKKEVSDKMEELLRFEEKLNHIINLKIDYNSLIGVGSKLDALRDLI